MDSMLFYVRRVLMGMTFAKGMSGSGGDSHQISLNHGCTTG